MRPRSRFPVTALIVLGCLCAVARSDDDSGRVAVSQLNDHLYLITCTGGEEYGMPPFGANIVASVGPDGILLTDAAFESTGEELAQAVRNLSPDKKIIVVNTHHHGDHTGGNSDFDNDAVIMAHHNVVDRMSGNYFHLPGTPDKNRPIIGLADSTVLLFNGEEIHVVHTPNCHTDGDAYIYFVDSKVLAIGDLVFSDQIPYIDLYSGGTVDGYSAQVGRFIDGFPDDATFVPSHGRVYVKDDLKAYHEMLTETTRLIRTAAADGKSVEHMTEENLLADWLEWNGSFPTTSLEAWMTTVVRDTRRTGDGIGSICQPMTQVLIDGSGEDAVGLYADLKASAPDAYDFGEAELNMLGYQLLFRNRADDALKIFELNIEVYPNSFNVYDSYGEALLAKGDTARAIINYRKSLELNPDNTNAAAVLDRLARER